jgi:hypothetical protein
MVWYQYEPEWWVVAEGGRSIAGFLYEDDAISFVRRLTGR